MNFFHHTKRQRGCKRYKKTLLYICLTQLKISIDQELKCRVLKAVEDELQVWLVCDSRLLNLLTERFVKQLEFHSICRQFNFTLELF